MIEPTHGRIVWYWPGRDFGGTRNNSSKPLAAIIVHAFDPYLVNLTVFDSEGVSHPVQNVTLFQDENGPRPDRGYAEWMPYQKGQAAKTEALERQIGA